MTSSADADNLPFLSDDVDTTAVTMMETVSSPQEQTDVIRMDNDGLSELFRILENGEKYYGEKTAGEKLSYRRIQALAGIKSMRSLYQLYREWQNSAVSVRDRVVRRQVKAGNGKLFLDRDVVSGRGPSVK